MLRKNRGAWLQWVGKIEYSLTFGPLVKKVLVKYTFFVLRNLKMNLLISHLLY